MKLSLMVAQGVHEGKVIPITVSQFHVGRDESCQLRPASAAVSKRHCAVYVRSGKVFVRDIGSTNGTFVNNEQITQEVEVKNGDRLKIGPLEFVIQVDVSSATPRPENKTSSVIKAAKPPVAGGEKSSADTPKPAVEEEDSEKMAAMLLGTDDGPSEPITADKIPAGTTVFEMPAVGQEQEAGKTEKPKDPNVGNTSNAAAAILKKYMQRPRT